MQEPGPVATTVHNPPRVQRPGGLRIYCRQNSIKDHGGHQRRHVSMSAVKSTSCSDGKLTCVYVCKSPHEVRFQQNSQFSFFNVRPCACTGSLHPPPTIPTVQRLHVNSLISNCKFSISVNASANICPSVFGPVMN